MLLERVTLYFKINLASFSEGFLNKSAAQSALLKNKQTENKHMYLRNVQTSYRI